MRLLSACILLIFLFGGEWKASQCGLGFWRITLIEDVQLKWYNGSVFFEDSLGWGVVLPTTKVPLVEGWKSVLVERIVGYTYEDESIYFLFQDDKGEDFLGEVQRVPLSIEERKAFPLAETLYKFVLSASLLSPVDVVYKSRDWIGVRSYECMFGKLWYGIRVLLLGISLFLFARVFFKQSRQMGKRSHNPN